MSLKDAREAAGVSQARLADMIGSGRSTIAKIEAGERPLTLDMAKRVAKALGIEIQEIYVADPVNVVGYVGAGSMVTPFDDYAHGGGMDQIERPYGVIGRAVAVEVQGDSMIPTAENGWRIIYTDGQTLDESKVLNRICVVKCEDETMYVKRVLRGTQTGRYHLASTNAPMMEDVAILWASPVKAIIPR